MQHITLPAFPMPKQKRSNADVSTSDSSPSSVDERYGRKDKKAKKVKAKEKERKHAKRREKHRKHKKERKEKHAKVLSYLNFALGLFKSLAGAGVLGSMSMASNVAQPDAARCSSGQAASQAKCRQWWSRRGRSACAS